MEEIDTWNTDDMICPFCGCIVDSIDYDDSDDIGTCDECGKEFDLEFDYSVTYTTSKPKQMRGIK